MQSQIFWLGYYNLDIAALLDRLLRPGQTVIDVGANVGEVSLLAARRVGNAGRVLAFEPLPQLAEQLELNARRNGMHQIKVVRKGLANFQGSLPIYLPDNRHSDSSINSGLGTLYPSTQRNRFAGSVPLTSLDKYLADNPVLRLDLIKIDIEGAELPCLQGAATTLRRFKPIIIIEVQDDTARTAGYEAEDILNFLRHHSYKLFCISRGGKLKPLEAIQSFQNLLCLPVNPSQ